MTIGNREVMDEFKLAQAQGGGRQLGGGAKSADQDAAGGSSGSGGYGNAFDQASDTGDEGGARTRISRELSRGERHDLEQGGARSVDSLEPADELTPQERERAELGQRFIDEAGARSES